MTRSSSACRALVDADPIGEIPSTRPFRFLGGLPVDCLGHLDRSTGGQDLGALSERYRRIE